MTASALSIPAPDEPIRTTLPDSDEVVYVEGGLAREPFVVDNDRKATWAMRRLAEVQAMLANIQTIATAEHDRIQMWAEEEARKLAPDVAYFEAQLIRYARQRREESDGKVKSISTPYGKVTSTATQPKYTVDPVPFLAWAKENRPEWVRVKEEPALDAIKAGTTVEDTDALGLVAVSEHGEIIPGVTVEPAGVNFKVKVES